MTISNAVKRRLPAGAEIVDGGVSFRVWAPDHVAVTLVLEGGERSALVREAANGYFSLFKPGLKAGTRYRFALDGADDLLPDPASRFQPQGITGPSVVVDPRSFAWHDAAWTGLKRDGQVIYEMHVGTFTPDGTWSAAAERLSHLRALGVTVLEIMPLNEFQGDFGWSYDGVLPYAPTRIYGEPDDVRRFIDQAHAIGLGVILDVVYNHFGVGEVAPKFAKAYYSDAAENEWGRSINFDGPGSEAVRDYFAGNAAYWIDEFHFDGLRLDATQALRDTSAEHIIARIGRDARTAARGRSLLILAENEPQLARLVRSVDDGGDGLDGIYNEDFHHAARVALTGRTEGYFHDYRGRPQEFVSAAKHGFLFQGQRYDWQDFSRGAPALDLVPSQFVHFLQNHDQVANSPGAVRIDRRCAPARLRAMTALLLLGPQTPMLFQGQEFCSGTPFCFFSDQSGEEAEAVRQGRVDFLGQFPSERDPAVRRDMRDPSEPATFMASKLDWDDLARNHAWFALHRDLLALRREDPTLRRAGAVSRSIEGAVIDEHAFLLRFFGDRPEMDRLLMVNLGGNIAVQSFAEPLSAPPQDRTWSVIWSSEHRAYGGDGRRDIDVGRRWVLTGETALVLAPAAPSGRPKPTKDELGAWQGVL